MATTRSHACPKSEVTSLRLVHFRQDQSGVGLADERVRSHWASGEGVAELTVVVVLGEDSLGEGEGRSEGEQCGLHLD